MDKKMKKNKALRAAGALFVAAMLTTSVVSGTFAKYVTQGKGKDQARVAKFGVEVMAGGDLFKDEYSTDDTSYSGSITVKSSGDVNGIEKVVAPGTKGDLNFSVNGQPEVAVRVNINVNCDKDIYLGAGTYNDVTGDFANTTNNQFTLGDDYHPIVWTLTKSGSVVDNLEGVKLEDINTYFQNNPKEFEFAPNTDLSSALADYTLTWEWPFGSATGISGSDYADTILGDLAAENKPDVGGPMPANNSTEINVIFEITVTQID